MNEELISEKDMPRYLKSLEYQALTWIKRKDLINAIGILKKCEEVIESVMAQGGLVDSGLIISVLYNISYCYQEHNDIQNFVKYIEACYYSSVRSKFIKGRLSKCENKIRKYKFKSKLALQCSKAFFLAGSKQKSLKYASAAFENSCRALQDTFEACKKHQNFINNKLKRSDLTLTEKNLQFLLQRAVPALEAANLFLIKGILQKVDMRSALGVKGNPDWLSMFKTNDLLDLEPIRSSDFSQGLGIQAEFSKDYLFYKIGLAALSLNILGIRNIQTGNHYLGQKYCESAEKFLKNFFSPDCQLVQEVSQQVSQSPVKSVSHKPQRPRQYNISKFSLNSASFRNIHKRPPENSYKPSTKKKVRRSKSLTAHIFKDLKYHNSSPSLN